MVVCLHETVAMYQTSETSKAAAIQGQEAIHKYFHELGENNLMEAPERINDMDETGTAWNTTHQRLFAPLHLNPKQ